MKKILKYLIYFVGGYFLLYLCAPFSNGSLTDYTEPFYWLKILLVESVILFPALWLEIIPRKHITITLKRSKHQQALWIGGIILSSGTMLSLMIVIVNLSDDSLIKPFLIALWVLFLPILFRVFFFRGVSFYRNKKIKIFKLKTTAYQNAVINDITVSEFEKNTQINIVINEQDNCFTVSSLAEAYAYKSMMLQAINAVKENKFFSFFHHKKD